MGLQRCLSILIILMKNQKTYLFKMQAAGKKVIKHKKMVKGSNKNEFFLEDEEGRPIGMIINKEK